MLKRFFSTRFGRWPATFAWIAALSVSAWVAADSFLLFAAPGNISATFRSSADPATAAQKIVDSAPLAVETRPVSEPTADSPTYALIGVATGFGSERGFALLKSAGGGVIPATEGETLAPHTRLVKIHADRVEIERSGITRTLHLELPQSPGSSLAAATATAKPDR
ncbi:type II secretion system protein N [Aromatoleum anaerobium]|uniref:Type II secretion system protein GspC N-terminal domain-containing protein n=1 Tax=Aromatoleum anaerobium TaxID=182180 RepID=A0ABX1PGL0_9RHOO|nr:type II secretion system protein N [Aromatoleum anaerobium]MCK0508834.1 hypothetical protein [Aromatoleum anaerobium]